MRRHAILTVGFGTTVALWAVGYVARLPAVLLPAPALLVLLLVCLVAGGAAIGRRPELDVRAGAWAGLVCGLLNLLILGSFLSGDDPGELHAATWIGVPGSLAVSAALGALGAAIGRRWNPAPAGDPAPPWIAWFARTAAVATMFLLALGGLVTSAEAGLAVVDWPNSFGYNMFLYPFSRMTGDIYYEHAHRLFGALVGLVTLALAVLLQRNDPRAWVRRLGWAAFAMVVVQGVLGGLRVTGTFTLSAAPEAMTPSTALALTHGVFGQLFFATLVSLAVFTSPAWRAREAPLVRASAPTDRRAAWALVGLLIVQLTLGASERHLSGWLIAHMAVGLALVTPLALFAGLRAWGLNPGRPLLQRIGIGLAGGVGVQVLLGILAFVATAGAVGEAWNLALATAHQWFGAILLALATLLAWWNRRLLAGEPAADPAADPATGKARKSVTSADGEAIRLGS